MLYNNGMIFYINHFSLIIFYHSVWLVFELIGSYFRCTAIGYSLHSHAEDMTITIVVINPRKERRLVCEWHHAQKRWVENLGILKKTSVGVDFGPCKTDDFVSAFGHRELSSLPWSRELESWLGPCRQTVEVQFRPWCWEVWVSTVEAYV